jgi:ribosome-associated toxin RatA of RatAB toxin-antitoxin module
MFTIKKQAIVFHSKERMFELVDQVEDYPTFLPWCGETEVLARNKDITRAKINIRFKGIKQSFTTENHKTYPDKMVINLIDGPFKKLEGEWRFIEIEEGSSYIELELNYEFKNFILEKLISPAFSVIANTFIDSFVAKANKDNHE